MLSELSFPREKGEASVPDCVICLGLLGDIDELREAKSDIETENTYLRAILSWVSSCEPQLGVMIASFKRGNGFGVGHKYTKTDFQHIYGLIGQASGEGTSTNPPSSTTPKPSQVSTEGAVFEEPHRAPPRKQVWMSKPNHLRNKLDTMPDMPPPRNPMPKPKGKAKPFVRQSEQRSPEPTRERPVRFHCKFCGRDGHLAEFYFKRKCAERREHEFTNQDRYYSSYSVPESSQREQRCFARPSRGGRGHGRDHRAPMSECFSGRAPSRSQYGYGSSDRDFGHRGFDTPCFGVRGGGQSYESRGSGFVLPEFCYPSVE